jgi:hypothetical protein
MVKRNTPIYFFAIVTIYKIYGGISMKFCFRIFGVIVISAVIVSPVIAQNAPNPTGTTETGIQFEIINTNTVRIKGYDGTTQTVVIPDRIQGLPVTIIGNWAFNNRTDLTSITIPSSVTHIGDSAFSFTRLRSVTIPASVTHIGNLAFYECTSLTNVTIPPSITHIGDSAFKHTRITSITIPSSVTHIGDGTFSCTQLRSVTIPASVTHIGNWAFKECTSLTNVTIPPSVTHIGDGAFEHTRITSINIPQSVMHIGKEAFRNTDLTTITIPASVTHIGKDAFGGCYILTSINVDNSNPAYASIDGVLFDKNIQTLFRYPTGKQTTTYIIPPSVTTIVDQAFFGSNLTNVTIPPSVTTIGEQAFSFNKNLTSVTIPESVTSIGRLAFWIGGKGTLANINVNSNNTSFTSVDGVLFDKNIQTLILYPEGRKASTYTIPSSVTRIGDSAFRNVSLTSITIPSSVKNIGFNAFLGALLTNVTISRRTWVSSGFPRSTQVIYSD